MTESSNTVALDDLRRTDRRILWLFSLLILLVFFWVIAYEVSLWPVDFLRLVDSFLGGLIFVFFATGVLAFKYHHGRGLIPMRTVLERFALISLTASLVITLILVVYISSEGASGFELVAGALAIYLVMALVVFLALLLILVMGFGIVGVMAVLERRYAPEILVDIGKITQKTVNPREGGRMMTYPALRWLYNIPDVLDTGSLSIADHIPRKVFPWRAFRIALVWEVVFSAIMAVYISLNPFFLGGGDSTQLFTRLFGISSSLSFFIPIMILPWFLYRRLSAGIEGPVKDFKLYRGLKSRMTQILATLGTIVVFVRVSLATVDFDTVVGTFASYYFFFVIGAMLITFAYFNYFDDDLAASVGAECRKRLGR